VSSLLTGRSTTSLMYVYQETTLKIQWGSRLVSNYSCWTKATYDINFNAIRAALMSRVRQYV
jgi:DUF2075 family protein